MTASLSDHTTAGATFDVEDSFPLTPIQFGMVFESALSGRASANIEQVVCWFDDEAVDGARLEMAWHHVQARHPSLRAAIRWTEPDLDDPVQVVHRSAPMPLAVHDWTDRAVNAGAVQDALEHWLTADREAGVDLEVAPAMRAALLVTGTRRSVFVWTFPHALVDGRSFAIVLDEVFAAYDDLLDGSEPALGPPPPPFREHVEAVRRVDCDGARLFFSQLLEGVDEPAPIPGGRAEPADEPDRPGSGRQHRQFELRLSAEMVARIELRAAQVGATVGSVLLSAWAVLLSRYTARLDVVFGFTRSGRHTHAAGALLIGCLINTVPFRVRPRPDRTINEMLREIRSLQLALRPYEQTSLMDVRNWSEFPNDEALVTTNVTFEGQLVDSRFHNRGGAWSNRRVEVREETAFPLGLAVYEDDGLLLRLEYEAGRYRPATIERMAGHLATLLESIAESGDETEIGMLRMMPAEERLHLVEDLNPLPVATAVRPVADTFEQVVGVHPTRTALVGAAGTADPVGYLELDRAANRLAHHLLASTQGCAPVAICLPRSVAFVEAVVASLKAGLPYVPLDPDFPLPALEHMLRDSGASLLITSAELATSLPVTSARLVVVDDDGERDAIAARPDVAPSRADFSLDSPAYVIYTSGSTGRPKGVEVSHRALAQYWKAVADRYDLTAADRVLQFSSLSFDVSIEELLPTLLRGATLVLRTGEMAESMAALLEWTARDGVTVLNLPTAFWHTLVDHLEEARAEGRPVAIPDCVRLVVTGGERASRQAYEAWATLAPGVRWLNGYGPTEATVTATVYDPAAGGPLGPGEEIPIGRPLPNARAYVLGGDGQWLMPEGMVGELWLGGSSLALGYLGQHDLTLERFRPDPFSTAEGARMYRTGDLVRWLPSGDLQFLGRADRQVKVRGFRIEPGEVEAALEIHPAVRRAFVAPRAMPGGDEQLIGWVVPAGSVALDLEEVLASVRATVAAHLVPAALVRVDRLVRTPGGKIDVKALPAPTTAASSTPSGSLDPAVIRIAELYRDVLGWGGRVGPDDSFFELGGHSLLAVRLLGRIEREFGVRLSLAALHEGPTPSRVWATVSDQQHAGPLPDSAAYLVRVQPEGSRPPIFGVHVLGTNACYYRPLAGHLGPDQPVLGLSISEPSDDTPTAIADIAALYAAEIGRCHPEGPLSLAAVSMAGYVAFELAHQLRRQGRDVLALVLFDADGPGGRASVSRNDRVRIHLQQLRAVGPRYLVGRAERVVDGVRERFDALRLRAHRSLGRETPDELWMHQFVMANVRAVSTYEAEPYVGRLVVFRAIGELFDAPEATTSALGWSSVAAGRVDVVEVPGQHLSMLGEPAVATLASAVRQALATDTDTDTDAVA